MRNRRCQISVRGETYRAIRTAAHCRGLPVGPLVDGLLSLYLDSAEREKPAEMKIGTNIGALIENSSVGQSLKNLRDNPEDELAKLSADLELLPREFGGNAPAEPKPQPRTRRSELAPLTPAELAARHADASTRARARERQNAADAAARSVDSERRHRERFPTTHEIVRR